MDLFANEWTTFRRITLPLIMPGVGAAAALAFALSIDDFVVTQFNSGAEITFPLYIYGASRNGVPVQVNVIGSLIFMIGVGGMFLNLVVQNRRAKRDALASAGALRTAQAAEARHRLDRQPGAPRSGRHRVAAGIEGAQRHPYRFLHRQLGTGRAGAHPSPRVAPAVSSGRAG